MLGIRSFLTILRSRTIILNETIHFSYFIHSYFEAIATQDKCCETSRTLNYRHSRMFFSDIYTFSFNRATTRE